MNIFKQNLILYFLIPLVLFLFVSSYSSFAYVQSGSISMYGDSEVIDCLPLESYIEDITLEYSTVDCSNISNSVIFYSTIRNASVNITDAELNFATIYQDILTSGQMIYGGYTFYGPFSLEEIYRGAPPTDLGVFGISQSVINSQGTFYASYSSGKIGYSVIIDATNLGLVSTYILKDDGLGNDEIANDGLYTSDNITSVDGGPGYEELILNIDDGLGNLWTISHNINVDSEFPTGDFYISKSGDDADSEYVTSRAVTLYMSASDNLEVDSCRFANSEIELNSASFDPCVNSIPWILSYGNDMKTVYYQVKDTAGNVLNLSDDIELKALILPSPIVHDPDPFWGNKDYIEFSIQFDDIEDSSGVTYDYRLYNATGCADFEVDVCNVTSWMTSTTPDIKLNLNFNLSENTNYSVGVISYSGYKSPITLSDGFYIDVTPPQINEVIPSIINSSWVNVSVLSFIINSSDNESGIVGYSYIVSKYNVTPDDSVDYVLDTLYVAGLSEGQYYINFKAKSGSSAFSDVYSYSINVDTTRPPIPFILTSKSQGANEIRINWTSVSDVSGIEEYELVISTDSSFSNIIETNSIAGNTYFDFNPPYDQTFYFKVRALNGAGLYSPYSDEYDEAIDIVPPVFVLMSPSGLILSDTPLLHIETSEVCNCEFSSNAINYTSFEFTNSKSHDHKLSLEGLSDLTYMFHCTDLAGNPATNSTIFSIDTSKEITDLSIQTSDLIAFSSMVSEIPLLITSSNVGVSGLNPNNFEISIGDELSDDFGVSDLGDGNYLISFRTPENPGTHELSVAYGSISSSSIFISISELFLEVTVDIESSSLINSYSRITSSDQVDFSIGLASDSSEVIFNSSEVTDKLIMINKVGSGENLIYFTPLNISRLSSKNKLLEKVEFMDSPNPYFAGAMDDNYYVYLSLAYPKFTFIGEDYSSRGEHEISILNNGLDSDKNLLINVEIN